MKKVLVSIVSTFICILIYFTFFSLVWDKLFPYYYEDYLTHFFVAGLILIITVPLFSAIFLYLKVSPNFKTHYYNSIKKTNIAATLICISIVLYQYSGMSYSDSGGGYYKIESSDG